VVYSPSKVVACVKVDGKVLREEGNSVTLPFGSEYSVLIKNLNSVRIQCKVSVDGTDATDGVWLVVRPNADLELERFIRNGSLQAGNRFKFIERSKDIEEHRGIKADDGLIRIEYQVEKRPTVVDEVIHHHRHIYDDDYPYWPRPWPVYPRYPRPWWEGNVMKSSGPSSPMRGRSLRPSASASARRGSAIHPASFHPDNIGYNSFEEQGITVPGSESGQRFSWTESFSTSPSEVIVLQLRGAVGGKKATKAVTVKMKPQCQTCGKANKAGSQFCAKCGTALSLI